jgi:hypothetical protein
MNRHLLRRARRVAARHDGGNSASVSGNHLGYVAGDREAPARPAASSGASRAENAAARDDDLRLVDEISGFAAIFEPAVRIVVWRRARDEERAGSAAAAVRRTFLGRRFVFRCGPDAATAVRAAIPEPELQAVRDDVLTLGEALAELTGLTEIGVRLERADGAMCPRFHTDRVPARIVTTYCGPGTETVAPEDVEMSLLGPAGRGRADEDGLLRPGARIRRAASGDVVLMKGETWPGRHAVGAIHRSPQTTAADPRLVLTLDLV